MGRRILLIAKHFSAWCNELLHDTSMRCIHIKPLHRWHLEQLGRWVCPRQCWRHELRSRLWRYNLIFFEMVFAINHNRWRLFRFRRRLSLFIIIHAACGARCVLLSQLNLALFHFTDFILNTNQAIVCWYLVRRLGRKLNVSKGRSIKSSESRR